MNFISPMNCKTLPEDFHPEPGVWAVEQKFDGHRIVVAVNRNRPPVLVTAWSRAGNVRELPPHLIEAFAQFPNGYYDGELMVEGGRSFGVTELVNFDKLVYMLFDVLELDGVDMTAERYDRRRQLLLALKTDLSLAHPVQVAQSVNIDNRRQLLAIRKAIWDADGEGIVVKRRSGLYFPGKRSADFFKEKKLQSTVCVVIGFAPGAGEIIDRGPYAKVIVRDSAGTEFSVKTLNDEELHKLEMRGTLPVSVFGKWQHPDIGRELRIEFHEQTPSGKYRHPRWDRWEDE